jgi:hypothetical protein
MGTMEEILKPVDRYWHPPIIITGIAANLGVALSRMGRRVTAIDMDLAMPKPRDYHRPQDTSHGAGRHARRWAGYRQGHLPGTGWGSGSSSTVPKAMSMDGWIDEIERTLEVGVNKRVFAEGKKAGQCRIYCLSLFS